MSGKHLQDRGPKSPGLTLMWCKWGQCNLPSTAPYAGVSSLIPHKWACPFVVGGVWRNTFPQQSTPPPFLRTREALMTRLCVPIVGALVLLAAVAGNAVSQGTDQAGAFVKKLV